MVFDRLFGKRDTKPAGTRPHSERVLATLQGELRALESSADRERIVYTDRVGDRRSVYHDGRRFGDYEDVRQLKITSSGETASWWAQAGGAWRPVVGGEERGAFERLGGTELSPDGKRFAICGRLRDGWHVFLDGVDLGPYEDLSDVDFKFSPDGTHFAFGAMRGGVWGVVLDGVEQEHKGLLNNGMAFSDDGRRFAYEVQNSSGAYAVVDGHPQRQFDGVTSDFVFAPGGQRFAYVAMRGIKPVLVTEEGEQGEFASTAGEAPVFSPDGRHLAIAITQDSRTMELWLDGRSAMRCSEISVITFTPDSSRVGAIVRRGTQVYFVLDGKDIGPYDGLGKFIAFSPDSRRYAIAAMKSRRTHIVVDGEATRGYEQVGGAGVLFSADSAHAACTVVDHKRFISIVDSTEGGAYPLVAESGIAFASPDEIRYIAFQGAEKGQILLVSEPTATA